MADKKIQPTKPTVEAKKAEDPKFAERKTAAFKVGRKSGRKTNSAKCF